MRDLKVLSLVAPLIALGFLAFGNACTVEEAAGAGGTAGASAGGSGGTAGSGATAGSGGGGATGGSGGAAPEVARIRFANLFIKDNVKPANFCIRNVTKNEDFASKKPFATTAIPFGFVSKYVKVPVGEYEIRFVPNTATDCATKIAPSDLSAKAENGGYYTFLISGGNITGDPASQPLTVNYFDEPKTADADKAQVMYYNATINTGPKGLVTFNYTDAAAPKAKGTPLAPDTVGVERLTGKIIKIDELTGKHLNVHRDNTGAFIGGTASPYDLKKGGLFTLLAFGWNEFAFCSGATCIKTGLIACDNFKGDGEAIDLDKGGDLATSTCSFNQLK